MGAFEASITIYPFSVLYGETLHSSPSPRFSMITRAEGDITVQFTRVHCRFGAHLSCSPTLVSGLTRYLLKITKNHPPCHSDTEGWRAL